MALTLAQVLNDYWWATGNVTGTSVYPPSLAAAQQYMSSFNSDNDLINYVKAHANDQAVVGGATAAVPSWAVSAMGDQVGASAAYLNTPLAPIIIEAAAQGWDAAHLQNAIQQSPYYQQNNATQLSWQTMSAADREIAIDNVQTKMAADAVALYGPDWTSGAIPGLTFAGLRQAAELVASGGETYDVWHWLTQQSAQSAQGTPAAQQVMAAKKAAGAEAVSVSNIAQQLGDTWRQWVGDATPPPQNLQQWASNISMNVQSQADFLNLAKSTAEQLYPNKPANLDYSSWVQQPKSVIAGTLELPSVADSDLLLQSFIRPGSTMNLGDLKLAAQQDPRYDQTQTATTQARQLGSQLLSTWGFAPGSGL
jgi:hypothetical protein